MMNDYPLWGMMPHNWGFNMGNNEFARSYITHGLIQDYANKESRELADMLLDQCADLAQFRDGELTIEAYAKLHVGAVIPAIENIDALILDIQAVARSLYRLIGDN